MSERWCKKFGGQAGLTSKGCGEKACLGCGMAECDSSFVYSTVRAFARKEDNLADDEHHHSCWLIGKAAYAPAYNTDEVSACEAATTGGAAAAVRSAHTVLASPPVIGPHCPWCGAPASAHTVRYRTAVASAPSPRLGGGHLQRTTQPSGF